MDFLNEQVGQIITPYRTATNGDQAQKFSPAQGGDDDDELEEDSMLEAPLDKVEPYTLFKSALISESLSHGS